MKFQNVKIVSNGVQIFEGILCDFVEGFVYDEDQFYRDLRFKGLKSFPNITIPCADLKKDVTVMFNEM